MQKFTRRATESARLALSLSLSLVQTMTTVEWSEKLLQCVWGITKRDVMSSESRADVGLSSLPYALRTAY